LQEGNHVLRTILAFIVVFSAASAQAGAWSLMQKNGEPVVEATGTAAIGDLRVNAFLSFSCNKKGEPAAWLDYTIADADKVTKVFDLEQFEGPDAPAQAKALVTIELEGASPAKPLTAHASGWMSSEHAGGFGFGVGGVAKESKELSLIIKRMAIEGTLFRIRIYSFGKPQRILVSEFPLGGSREAFKALSAVCR
jgi:hypothetical protein